MSKICELNKNSYICKTNCDVADWFRHYSDKVARFEKVGSIPTVTTYT